MIILAGGRTAEEHERKQGDWLVVQAKDDNG